MNYDMIYQEKSIVKQNESDRNQNVYKNSDNVFAYKVVFSWLIHEWYVNRDSTKIVIHLSFLQQNSPHRKWNPMKKVLNAFSIHLSIAVWYEME